MLVSEISLGSLLSIALTLVSSTCIVVGFVWAIRASVTVLNVRLDNTAAIVSEVKQEISKLTTVVTQQAVQSQRIDGIMDIQQQYDRRLMLQGERLDRLEIRVNKYHDDK